MDLQLKMFKEEKIGNDYSEFCKGLGNKDFLLPDEFGKSLSKWANNHVNNKIRTLGLFSGAGGLDIGFHDAGFDVVETVELESKFAASQLANKKEGTYLSNTNVICEDINLYKPKLKKIDFIIGGPPCQSFSAAGRRAAGVRGTNDERGGLFWEYARVLKKLKPKGFLFENVYGLLGAQKGQAIKEITSAFEALGYTLSYRILDTADYGVPQHRERLILVGLRGQKFKFPRPTNGIDSKHGFPHLSASQAFQNVPKGEVKQGLNGRFGHLLNEIPEGLNYSFFTEKMGHPNPIFAWRSKFSDFLYKADSTLPVRTLKASGGQYTGPFHWENRKFTKEELKRLQTFPDDYIVEGNYGTVSKQIGNSVPPQFSRILAISILDQVFDINLPFKIEYLRENEPLSFRKEKSKRTKRYYDAAQEAISRIDSNKIKSKRYKSKKYSFSIDSKQAMVSEESPTYDGASKLKIKSWEIDVKDSTSEMITVSISITSKTNKELFDKVKSIKINLYSDNPEILSAGYKILDKELIRTKSKADLVQLSGYYQYSSDLQYEFKFENPKLSKEPLWNMLFLISNDSKIGDIQSLQELERRYDISKKDLKNNFKSLRKMGFEIRNSNTNPEIQKDHFLIPYKFPTLTSQSVQLNKKL